MVKYSVIFMTRFNLVSKFKPTGDQPRAIEKLTAGISAGKKYQTLLGVTGSGKTFTMANVINRVQKPTLIISHNKTLAAQLYQEFKEFFPENAVHYFVSYYDYYQPEAYIPQSDTYIEKDAAINEELDRMRHAATQSLLSRPDTIIVASVSCIYNIGSPQEYKNLSLEIFEGQKIKRKELLSRLVNLQYERNEFDKRAGTFSAKGEIIEVRPSTGEEVIKIEIPKDEIKSISASTVEKNSYLNAKSRTLNAYKIFPAKFWVAPQENITSALANIRAELRGRLKELKKQGKLLEAERLTQRTNFDMEMLKESGYCHGIENYSRHLEFREPDSPPFALLDYFKAVRNDWLIFIDESHMSVPQIRGMYHGDRSRKETLINYGFRLPSALDNRPLRFEEFEKKVPQAIFVSATPALYELQKSDGRPAEQLIRPTGLLDPLVEVRQTKNQINGFIKEIKARVAKKQRVLATVLTKRLAEELSDYLKNEGVKVNYLHSEIKTLERPEILRNLRLGAYDVIVGVNLLREGLDLPEVSLVAIFDADKEGFLRNATTLIQTIGRVARHAEGKVIMYADNVTGSMRTAIKETERRRKIQEEYNQKNGITPQTIVKPVGDSPFKKEDDWTVREAPEIYKATVAELERQMKKAAKELDFEKAARIRDMLKMGKK